jgi:hypothetical protein
VKTITALAAKKLGKFLAKDFRRIFGPAQDDMAERLFGNTAKGFAEVRKDGKLNFATTFAAAAPDCF